MLCKVCGSDKHENTLNKSELDVLQCIAANLADIVRELK